MDQNGTVRSQAEQKQEMDEKSITVLWVLWVAGRAGAGVCVESQVEQVRTERVVVKCVLGRSQSRKATYVEWIWNG